MFKIFDKKTIFFVIVTLFAINEFIYPLKDLLYPIRYFLNVMDQLPANLSNVGNGLNSILSSEAFNGLHFYIHKIKEYGLIFILSTAIIFICLKKVFIKK